MEPWSAGGNWPSGVLTLSSLGIQLIGAPLASTLLHWHWFCKTVSESTWGNQYIWKPYGRNQPVSCHALIDPEHTRHLWVMSMPHAQDLPLVLQWKKEEKRFLKNSSGRWAGGSPWLCPSFGVMQTWEGSRGYACMTRSLGLRKPWQVTAM